MSQAVSEPSSILTTKFLVRHLGNMGDMIFIVPPVLAALKTDYPGCHITLVTSWGYKQPSRWPFSQTTWWGERNQSGHSLHLIMTNPHIDQLIHWHDRRLSLSGTICHEDDRSFPTWNKSYYEEQVRSGRFDRVIELDFGLSVTDNPLTRAYAQAGLTGARPIDYHLYLTASDRQIGEAVMSNFPRPRIVLLESLSHHSTRGWDPAKVIALSSAITEKYGVEPIWFGSKYHHYYHGRPLSMRENIATLTVCDVGIGVLSGPLHFAAAAGLPTLTLYCDHPLRRAAPAYFQNPSLPPSTVQHRTLLGPHKMPMRILKGDRDSLCLTPTELAAQNFINWSNPGKQSTKSCLSVITVDEIMTVLSDMLK